MKGLLPFIIALGVVSGQQTTKVISVNDPRPLSEAILKLEKATGLDPVSWTISQGKGCPRLTRQAKLF